MRINIKDGIITRIVHVGNEGEFELDLKGHDPVDFMRKFSLGKFNHTKKPGKRAEIYVNENYIDEGDDFIEVDDVIPMIKQEKEEEKPKEKKEPKK